MFCFIVFHCNASLFFSPLIPAPLPSSKGDKQVDPHPSLPPSPSSILLCPESASSMPLYVQNSLQEQEDTVYVNLCYCVNPFAPAIELDCRSFSISTCLLRYAVNKVFPQATQRQPNQACPLNCMICAYESEAKYEI